MTEPLRTGWTRFLLTHWLTAGMVMLAGSLSAQNTTVTVQPGSTVHVSGGTTLLKDVNINCNGQWQSGGGTTLFTGNHPTIAGGSGTIGLWKVDIAKSQTVALTLSAGMQIGNALHFTRGLIDLNDQLLQLTDTARVTGETDSGRITSLHGGKVVAAPVIANAPDQLNVGNLGAVLTSTANLGTLSVDRMPTPASGVGIGIQRIYLIQPQNNTALAATLRFYYLDAELNGADAEAMSLWKSTDGIAWTLIGADSRDTAAHYVEKTGIADLSYWTLADITGSLPLTLKSFSAVCDGNDALVEWKTSLESQLNDFLVQRSADDIAWSTIGSVPARNVPDGAAYTFKDVMPLAHGFYRLKIEDLDGTATYSPVFRGGCSDIALPFLVYPNPAVSQTVAQISVRQPANGRVQVLNISGGVVYDAGWNLQPGLNQLLIPISGWASGTYVLRLVIAGSTQTTQFIKL